MGDVVQFGYGEVEDAVGLLRERYVGLSKAMAEAISADFGADVVAVLGGKTVRRQAFDSLMENERRDVMMEMLSRIWDARDARLAVGCLFFAMGRPPLGAASFRTLASKHGVSPQAVSDEVNRFQEMFGLPKTEQQKSAAACDVYTLTNGARSKEAA